MTVNSTFALALVLRQSSPMTRFSPNTLRKEFMAVITTKNKMKAIKIFIGVIVTAFVVLIIEFNRYLIEMLGKFNYWLVPPEHVCLKCNKFIDDFNIEIPFCDDCIPEILEEMEPEYIAPPDDDYNAYR